jgi:hypothetical protein
MLTLRGKREEIYKKILENKSETKVHLATKPSKNLFLFLLKNLDLKEIYVSEGIYNTIPKNILNGLKNASINLILIKSKKGRPFFYSLEQKKKVVLLLKKGYRAKKIKELTNLPLSTIYMIKKFLKQNKLKIN